MCLGRINTGIILRAVQLGADGVVLLGCEAGGCHYEVGIRRAKESITQTKRILNLLGIGSKRVHLIEVKPGEGDYVARRINAFVRRTRGLGPSPIKSQWVGDELTV